MAASSRLRVAMVQFAPKIGEVHANIAKARELCRGLTPRSVDLVCFPEMIFSGYMFPDAPSIAPYLEHPRTGPTSTFCAQLARDLQCYVVAGLPELLEPPSGPPHTDLSATICDVSSPLLGANAALLFDPTGQLLHTYHKSNLFPTDITWARPGPGFTTLDLPPPFGRTALAICNDLNVSVREGNTWQSIEWGPYELARYCKRESVKVLVLLNSWLKPEDEVEIGGDNDNTSDCGEMSEDEGDAGLDPNWEVLNYWAMRLRPLWAEESHEEEDEEQSETLAKVTRPKDGQDIIVIISNRFGRERGKIFVGSSAIFSMSQGSGKRRLLHAMGEGEEGVRTWTTRFVVD